MIRDGRFYLYYAIDTGTRPLYHHGNTERLAPCGHVNLMAINS